MLSQYMSADTINKIEGEATKASEELLLKSTTSDTLESEQVEQEAKKLR